MAAFKAFKALKESKETSQKEASSTSLVVPTILVVDDDPDMRTSVKMCLSGQKCDVVLCDCGERVEHFIDDSIYAVLLDVKMPGIDGFETYEKIRSLDPDLPIIFHSAYQDLKDPYKIMNQHRPFGYLIKGDDLSVMVKVLQQAILHRERLLKYRQTMLNMDRVKEQMEALQKRLNGK